MNRLTDAKDILKTITKANNDITALKDIVLKLAEYEDAEEQGLLIRLPCKVGDTVYEANAVRKIVSTYKVTSIIIMTGSKNYGWELMDGVYSNINGFNEYALGKSVFLNREAAEEALKELEG